MKKLHDNLLILMVSEEWRSASIETRAAMIVETCSPRGRMLRPTAAEVQTYSDSIHAGVNGQQFLDHYTANGWLVGKAKAPMKDWQAAVRTWKNNRTLNIRFASAKQPLKRVAHVTSNEEMY